MNILFDCTRGDLLVQNKDVANAMLIQFNIMDLNLRNKTVVITGGSVGIGNALAHAFAAEGANIVICARKKEKLEFAAEELRKTYSVKILSVVADVSRAEDIDNLICEIGKNFKGIDILINNAGMGSEETIMNANDEKWNYYWNLHVMAAVRLSRGIIPMMKRQGGGAILNTASICAKQPLYYEPIYNTTKASLVMFSKCLANEMIQYNIRVNTVNPGLVLTPDWKNTATILGRKEGISADEYLNRIAVDNTPIKRFASPEEIANLYLFLCSDKASYCAGATYYIDGGWLKVID